MQLTRRAFFEGAAVVASTMLGAQTAFAQRKNGPWVCAFSKYLQFLDFKALAKTAKAIGLDGVDLTVRKGGHVEPDRLTDLAFAVEAVRDAGLEIPMVTTSLNSGADPQAEPILAAVAENGIPYVRIGGLQYQETGNPKAQLETFTEGLRSLADLAQKHQVTLGYHNHSGYLNFGAAIWDLSLVIETIDSAALGANFDAGHAAVEGAYGVWQVNARLIAPRVKMMAVKDFVWDKNKPQWVPLGKGIVRLKPILEIMRQQGFSGPISIHIEYKAAGNDAMIGEFQTSAAVLRREMEAAGYNI